MTALHTALVDRPRLSLTDAASGERAAGAYQILRRVVRGPGADLWAGTGPDGTSVLVQSVVLRAVDSHAEAVERGHVERAVIVQARLDHRDLLAHGAVDRAGGLREIYWVLRDPKGIHPAEPNVVALDLARRLVEDHRAGRSAPLLDATFLVERDGRTAVVGVPVAAPAEWLAPGALAWRAAPEETIRRTPCPSGDLWRLGQTLAAYAHGRTIPAELAAVIDALAGPVHRRPSRATEVVAWIESFATPGAPAGPRRTPARSSASALFAWSSREEGAYRASATDDSRRRRSEHAERAPARGPSEFSDVLLGATIEYSLTGLDLLDGFVRDHAATTFDAPRAPDTIVEAAAFPSAPDQTIAVVTLVPADVTPTPLAAERIARIGIPAAQIAERPLIEAPAERAFFESTSVPPPANRASDALILLIGVGALLGVLAALCY